MRPRAFAAVVTWRAAVRPAKVGVNLDVEVVPGSSESRFPCGYNDWRKRLEAKVRAPPSQGQANAELEGLVAAALTVAPAAVRVSSGLKSRQKGITIAGLSCEEAVARLAKCVDLAD